MRHPVRGGAAGLPGVTLLTTSREALGVPGEVTLAGAAAHPSGGGGRSPPAGSARQLRRRAPLPGPGGAGPAQLHRDQRDGPGVAEICSRHDGIPLAIELAAARVRLLSPQQVLAGLQDRFRLLTGGARSALPRQQTLEASVAWSHDQLSDDERLLFRRLAVFAGRFTLDAATDPTVGSFEGVGSDLWQGTWTGVSSFTFRGTVNLVTGAGSGTLQETLFGRSTDGGTGTMSFTWVFTVGPDGHVLLRGRIVDATGDFTGARGTLVAEGTGVGGALSSSGTYHGDWSRPDPSATAS